MMTNGERAALSLLQYLHTRGAHRVGRYETIADVPWQHLYDAGLSSGERAVFDLADDWAVGLHPPVAGVLAKVDPGYQSAIAEALDILTTPGSTGDAPSTELEGEAGSGADSSPVGSAHN